MGSLGTYLTPFKKMVDPCSQFSCLLCYACAALNPSFALDNDVKDTYFNCFYLGVV